MVAIHERSRRATGFRFQTTMMRSRRARVVAGGSLLSILLIGTDFMSARAASAQVLCLTKSGSFGPCPSARAVGSIDTLPFSVPVHGPTKHIFASGVSLVPGASTAGFIILAVGLAATLLVVLHARLGRGAFQSSHPTKAVESNSAEGYSRSGSAIHSRDPGEFPSSENRVAS
jgi:hypothetical protein